MKLYTISWIRTKTNFNMKTVETVNIYSDTDFSKIVDFTKNLSPEKKQVSGVKIEDIYKLEIKIA